MGTEPRADLLARLTGWMAHRPAVSLVALVAAQTGLGLAHGDLWYIDEVRHASVLRGLLDGGHWVVLSLDGVPYPDKPPVYFWLLAGLARLLGTDGPIVHAIAVALSAIVLALVTHWLARRVGGLDREGALLAALVLISTAFVIERSHAPRMDLLFAALIALASGSLFLGWRRPSPSGRVVAGFALAGVATLVKGPLGLLFPLLASVAFLAFRGRLRRLARQDVVAGAIVAAALVGAWLLACRFVEGSGFLRRMFVDQILHRAVSSPLQHEGVDYYWRVLPVAALPWTVVWLLAAPRLARTRPRAMLEAARHASDATVFLAAMVLVDLVVLSAMSYKLALYLLHVQAPLAVLTALRLLALDERERRLVRWALAAVFVAGAIALPLVPRFYPWPEVFRGLGWGAAGAGAVAALLLALRRDRPVVETVAALALAVTVAAQPLVLITRRSLDPVMSPRKLGEVIAGYARDGYTPVTFQIRDYRRGTLSYYAGQVVPDLESPRQLQALMAGPKPVVVVILGPRWKRAPAFMRAMTPVYRQRLDRDRWVVLVATPPPATPGGATR